MKICVLGAGVVGVSTAYALARLGHDVSVIDKGMDVASGASHANGAQLSYSYIDPFAGPQALRKLPSYLLALDPGVKLGLSLSPSYLRWGLGFIRNCSSAAAQKNLMVRWKLAQASQAALSVFESELSKDAIKRTGHGKLILAYSNKDISNMAKALRTKIDMGLSLSILSKAECLDREPALAGWSEDFMGGLYSDADTTLDPLVYCNALKSQAIHELGVRFFWDETITAIEQKGGQVSGVHTDVSQHECDHVVVCLGAEANTILKPLGISAPIYPMQGYSVTLPARSSKLTTSLTDPKHKIVFAGLGDKVRIAGFMDANQSSESASKRAHQFLSTASRLWPTLADYDAEPHSWTHFRPMMPSGVPIVGQSKIEGLSLNIGHGSLGYTFAAGSAMKIAEEIGHAQTNLSLSTGGQVHELRA